MSGLPYLDVEEIQVLFGYKNRRGLYNAIRLGRLPVSTYKIRGELVADKEVVRQFFAQKREEGLARLRRPV